MSVALDLSSATDRKKIQHGLRMLASRTVEGLQALHYLKDGEDWHCLDFDLHAGSREALDEAVQAAAAGMCGVMPTASTKDWMKTVGAHGIGHRQIEIPSTSRVVVIVAEHELRTAKED